MTPSPTGSDVGRTDETRSHASLFTVRREPPAPANGLPRDSGSLCDAAIRIYDELFRRQPELDPDIGLGECYYSGRRNLVWRQQASTWSLSADRFAAADALLAQTREVRGEQVIDAIATFPARLLALLDRRQRVAPSAGRHHRRWTDTPAHGRLPSSLSDGS